jgi:TonB family protein
MRYIFTWITLFAALPIFGQDIKIDSSNYYDFINKPSSSPITTNWLRRTEIVPIIKDELNRHGFKHSQEYKLYKLENDQFIILEIYNKEYNFGFVYKTGHAAIPKPSHRLEKTGYGISYNDYSGNSSSYIKVDLPDNIYLLNEDCYWYQYETDKNESYKYVNRIVTINILKEDIRAVLANYKDLEKALEETKWKQVRPDPQFAGFIFVDNWAKFIDGRNGLDNYIVENLNYPEKAKKKRIEEEIILEYEIRADGQVGEVNVIQGRNELLVNEAKRVIKNMPKWKPAKQKGKSISVKYGQKFNFKL